MQAANVRVESAPGNQGKQIVKEHTVSIGKQGIDRVVRWAAITGIRGTGLLAMGMPLLNVSVPMEVPGANTAPLATPRLPLTFPLPLSVWLLAKL